MDEQVFLALQGNIGDENKGSRFLLTKVFDDLLFSEQVVSNISLNNTRSDFSSPARFDGIQC